MEAVADRQECLHKNAACQATQSYKKCIKRYRKSILMEDMEDMELYYRVVGKGMKVIYIYTLQTPSIPPYPPYVPYVLAEETIND